MDWEQSNNLTAAYIDRTVIIQVEGRGSFRMGPLIKQFVHRIMEEHAADRIVVDMAGCTSMDSTFMGVVAGLACLIEKNSEYQFELINLSEKNQKLLVTLGVDRFVKYSMSTSGGEQTNRRSYGFQTLKTEVPTKLNTVKTSLEAHKTLVNICPENANKFKSVLEFLQENVQSLKQ